MRDPARIPRILTKLGELWSQQPDTRLAQLVHNTAFMAKNGVDPFYVEDSAMETEIDSLIQHEKRRKAKA